MRRRPLVLVPGLLFALLPIARPAHADPVMRFTWGPPSGLVLRQDFAGPATYAQTLSVTGLTGSVSRLYAKISHGPYRWGDDADAWRPLYASLDAIPATPPLNDCLGAPFYVATPAVTGATAIPNATLAVTVTAYPGITNFKFYSFSELELTIDPPLAADPGTTYAVATLEYHHQNTVVGPGGPGCHNGERAFCFVQQGASATVNGAQAPVLIEAPVLAWNHDPDAFFCLTAITPARGSTWGAVKTLYR